MSRTNVFGWALMTIGFVLWLYGYFVDGHAALVGLPGWLPIWIAEYLANAETQIGMAVMLVAMIPAYWPTR